MMEDEALLFSISIYSPPKIARVGYEGRIVGDGFAAKQEEYLTLGQRHRRACQFVSDLHR